MAIEIKKLSLAPAYRVISSDLRRQIVAGALKTGEALPTETELSLRYGVNRSTVREGLRQLEQEGLVLREGKRLLAAIPDPRDLATSAERALRMRQVTFQDVWDVANALEPLCARLAASAATHADLHALQLNLEATERVVDEGRSPVDVDIEFQNLVAQATHNHALQLARGPVSQLMRAGYAAIAPKLPQSGARLLGIHRQVLDAIRRQDGAAAQQAMLMHMADYKRGCRVAGLAMEQPIPHAD